jgi:hypothetical protein
MTPRRFPPPWSGPAIGSFWRGQLQVICYRSALYWVLRWQKGPSELGLSSTTDKQKEAAWRVEFEALGEQLVYRNVQRGAIYNDDAKRQAALRWLSERDRTAQLGWLAFFVAIAGVLVGIIALSVALD